MSVPGGPGSTARRVESGGTGIEYEVTGEGRPVILLHGFPDSGRLWRHQVPALADAGFQVIVPDLRGYGRSGKPADVEAYSLLLLAADVGAVLADLDVARAHVVGHDWGAALAWGLASLMPGSVDHLVALSVGSPARRFSPLTPWSDSRSNPSVLPSCSAIAPPQTLRPRPARSGRRLLRMR